MITKTTRKLDKPAEAPATAVMHVRISRKAYDIVMQKAKLTRRSFIVTLDIILGA